MRTSTTPGPSSWRTSSARPARRGPRTVTRSHGSPSMDSAASSSMVPCTERSGRPALSGTARTSAGTPGSEVDDVDLLALLALAEVQLQRRAAVVQGWAGGDALRAVEVAERAVPDGRRERRRGHGVLLDQVGRPLAASGRRAEDEGVGGEHVHGVGAEARRTGPRSAGASDRCSAGRSRTPRRPSGRRSGRCRAWRRTAASPAARRGRRRS